MPNKDDVVSEIIEKAAPVPDNSAQDYSDVPVYYEPFSYAKENDEVDLYRTSYRLNGECKQAIHEAIADNYDGMYLGDGAVDQVVRQYGMERVGYILANTLHHKNYDGRFSHSNKEWAEQVGTPENNARIIKFRADWVVTSHSAVLDGFVTMYREKLEKQKELEQPFVKRFYVVENRQAVPLEIKRFGNLNDAMSQYQALPNHYMKALGVEKNPDPLPGSLDILQCRNGIDTILQKMVRAALETNWKNGKATCTNVPFGYVRNKKGGQRWEIDPEAAPCVKKVFELALSGRNTTQIAYGMNELNLPTPGLYAKRKNLLMGSNPIIAPDSEMLWNAAIVWRILRRYEYTGALVMGRRKKIDVNTTSVRTLPEDKWIIAENAHAAIVTKDEYYQAQKAIRNVTPIQYKVGDEFCVKRKNLLRKL